ncbi:MAG TPA: hypothetical protein VFZ35_04005, partial [Sphingomicrobium sp.]
VLGSIPIIGSLFRSSNFQKDETELLIIVTPRLVRPVRPYNLKAPTDRVQPPAEADLFLLGRTDTGVPPAPGMPVYGPAPATTPAPAPAGGGGGGGAATAQKNLVGFEKEYGHEF